MPNPNNPEVPPAPDAQDAANETTAANPDAPPAAQRDTRIAELEKQLQAAQQEVLRSHAELENYRKRVRRDMDEERRYAALPVLADLLTVVDNLDRAIAHAEQAQGDSSAVIAGVRMIAQQLNAILEKHQCRPIPAAGEMFDPHVHEAIGQQPSNEHPAGFVSLVAQEGYQLHDRVIRPAQVLVSTGPATNNTPDSSSENSNS